MTSPVSQLKRQKYFLGLGGKNKTNQTVKVGRQFKHDGISLTRMCNTHKTNVTTGEKSKRIGSCPRYTQRTQEQRALKLSNCITKIVSILISFQNANTSSAEDFWGVENFVFFFLPSKKTSAGQTKTLLGGS
jgi:hypothetical protein